MSRFVLAVVLVASCHRYASKDAECDVIRDLDAHPREHANFIFQHLGVMEWNDPELKQLVDYATAKDKPADERAYPPYMWDATAYAKLRELCHL